MNTLVEKPENFINFMRLLEFSKNLTYSTEILAYTEYRRYDFSARDFIGYQNPALSEKKVQYSVKKIIEFFEDVQRNSFIQYFSEEEFVSLATIPICKIQKVKNKWMIELYIVSNLYNYNFPFVIPDFFSYKLNKYQFSIRYQILMSFLSKKVTKNLKIKEFFNSYSTLSNFDKTRCGIYLVENLELLINDGTIINKFSLLQDNNVWIEESIESLKNKTSILKNSQELVYFENIS